jgi:hypothetical protein
LYSFDPRQDFTLGAWLYLTGEHRTNTTALAIRCAELRTAIPLLSIGEYDRSGHYTAFRSFIPMPADSRSDKLMACGAFKPGWKYVALTQTSGRLNFYVGSEMISKPITRRQEIPATEVSTHYEYITFTYYYFWRVASNFYWLRSMAIS